MSARTFPAAVEKKVPIPTVFVLTLLVGLGSSSALSQNSPSSPALNRLDLPSEFEFYGTRYHFERDGTGRKEVIARILILTQMGTRQHGEEVFEYHPLSQDLYIKYLEIRKPDGKVVVVEADVHHPLPRGTTIDTDLDQRKIRLPALSVGDLIEYEVITTLRQPLGQGEFTVQHTFEKSGIIDEHLDVEIPVDQKVNIKDLSAAHFWQSSSGSWNTLHWENHSPQAHEVLFEEYRPGRTPDVQVSSFATWEDVGRWYAKIQEAASVVTPDVKARADEITAGLPNDSDKIKSLYKLVAQRIRYLSLVSFGIGGTVPHSASETLHNQYGDCKDKVALLNALLKAEGFSPSTVLISPDRDPDPTFPSPWPFDHVIGAIQISNSTIWLDPSSPTLAFGMLAYPLRAKTALVIPVSGVSRLQRTPEDSPIQNSWLETIEGTVTARGSLEATVTIEADGDAALPLRQAFFMNSGISPANAVPGLDSRDTITQVSVTDSSDTDHPFQLSFHVSIPSFIPSLKGEVAIQLPLSDLSLYLSLPSGNRSGKSIMSALAIGSPGRYQYEAQFILPPLASLSLPEPTNNNSAFALYTTSYSFHGTTLTTKRSLTIASATITPEHAEDYAKLSTEVKADDTRRFVVAQSE